MAAFPDPRRSPAALRAALLAALVAVLALPVPAAVAATGFSAPAAGPTRHATEAAAPRPFRINLAGGRDYVRQTTFVRCVGASIQMMLNIVEPGTDRSTATQRRLQVLARGLSGPRPDGSVRQGAGVFGWASALSIEGAGSYAVVGADSLQEAMRIAARAIVEQRRPVGLLVWQGRHAWVMSGFEATGDPRDGPFRVTRAHILDPLHPYGSSAWGPSPRPGTAIGVRAVGRQFVRRRTDSEWNRLPGMAELAGRWVLVVPVDGPQPRNPAVPDAPAGPPTPPRTGSPTAPPGPSRVVGPARAPADTRPKPGAAARYRIL